MPAINGHTPPAPPAAPDPRPTIAEAVYTIMMDEGDTPFAALDEEDRADIITLTEHYINAHVGWLTQQGFRLMPPGVTPIPKSAEEALAMVQAAKQFHDSQKRKSNLIGGKPKRLILPPGAKLQ